MGFALLGAEDGWHRFGVEGGGSGKQVDIKELPEERRGQRGKGSVHHVAWRVKDAEEQMSLREGITNAGNPHFTHIAFDDFRVVRDNLSGGTRVRTGRLVPFCLFTDPELARVGLSEREAMERGIHYRLFKVPMMAVGLPYTALRDAVLTHPTVAEGLIALFSAIPTKGGARR
jgi:hypothetical protein